jgi:hypothetical protein
MAIPKYIHRPAAWADPSPANAIEADPNTNTVVKALLNVFFDM